MKKWAEVLKYAVEINRKEKNYPVWGTCLGFEAIIYGFSKYKIPTTEVDTLNKNKRLIWKVKDMDSTLIGKELRHSVMKALSRGK